MEEKELIKTQTEGIEYIDEHWPKGNNDRGHAMVLFALGVMFGKKEMEYIMENSKTCDCQTQVIKSAEKTK